MIFMAKFLTKFQIIDIPDTKLNYPNGDLFLFVFPKMEVKLEPRPKKWNNFVTKVYGFSHLPLKNN